jgi:hypothetical protein
VFLLSKSLRKAVEVITLPTQCEPSSALGKVKS